MSEAGQIFALLRSWSAAELAKRFASGDGGAGPPRMDQGAVPLTSFAGTGAPSGGAGVGAGAAAAVRDILQVQGPADADKTATSLTDLPAALPGGPVRSAVSLGHLAPPRAELARLLAEALMLAEPATSADPFGSTGAKAGPMGGLAGGGAMGQAGLAGQVLAALSSADAGLTGEMLSQGGTFGAGAAGADDTVGLLRGGPVAGPGGDAALASVSVGDRTALARSQASGAAEVGLARGVADALAVTEQRQASAAGPLAAGQVGAGQVMAGQVTAFAETLTTLLALADGRGTATVASGVIFNAAMMPGWPFPSAFAKDGATAINPKALLHQLAAAVEGMSPEQAAEYMAKIGGGHAFLRGLRKLLKDLELTDKTEVKGLLFAFLETISTIAGGLQMAFKQMATTAALQAAVVHGEDPDEDGDRPGRRRLRL